MELVKLSLVFRIIIIIVIYFIIFYAIKAINSDMKLSNKAKRKSKPKKFGLKVEECGSAINLKRDEFCTITGIVTIGRREDNTFVLTDPYVSGVHAKVYKDGTEIILQDMGSTNGTYLNGEKVVGSTYLEKGDIIKIADTTLKVVC